MCYKCFIIKSDPLQYHLVLHKWIQPETSSLPGGWEPEGYENIGSTYTAEFTFIDPEMFVKGESSHAVEKIHPAIGCRTL